MVFFTCNSCGDSIKKASVEKHYQQKCRGGIVNVSCMDCLKDFRGEEYVAHIKCVTEAQKYSGKDYVAKENKNSNAKKQEGWMNAIHSILENDTYELTPQTRMALERLQTVDNVPRKKAKFENFVANCMRMTKPLATQVWDILEMELDKMKHAKKVEAEAARAAKEAAKATKAVNGRDQDEENLKPAEKKKRTVACVYDSIEDKSTVYEMDEKFQWSAFIAKVVQKHPDGIEVAKLKNKVFKKYKTTFVTDALNAKQIKHFEKKFPKHLKRCPHVEVIDGIVMNCLDMYKAQNIPGAPDLAARQPKIQNGHKRQTIMETGIDDDDEPAEKKIKCDDPDSDTIEVDPQVDDNSDEFDWSNAMANIVLKNVQGISLTKLKNKLLKKYKAKLNTDTLTERQEKKFEKKFVKSLKNCSALQVADDVAKACLAAIK